MVKPRVSHKKEAFAGEQDLYLKGRGGTIRGLVRESEEEQAAKENGKNVRALEDF